jgi:hypothetical protein
VVAVDMVVDVETIKTNIMNIGMTMISAVAMVASMNDRTMVVVVDMVGAEAMAAETLREISIIMVARAAAPMTPVRYVAR